MPGLCRPVLEWRGNRRPSDQRQYRLICASAESKGAEHPAARAIPIKMSQGQFANGDSSQDTFLI
jgi:hypothetical protein